jgi:GNAT superfamily N-acetyltransferase
MTDGLFIAKFFSADAADEANPVENLLTGQKVLHPRTMPTAAHRQSTPARHRMHGDGSNLLPNVRILSLPDPSTGISQHMMANNGFYFCIRVGKKIAALAAAEIDSASQTCEMTDFATLPEYRGRGLAKKLLDHLDVKRTIRDVQDCLHDRTGRFPRDEPGFLKRRAIITRAG